MPKRVIDGDRLWASDKIASIEPESFRAEYANILPLAMANGVFECDPSRVWMKVYAYNRPSFRVKKVARILDELERVRLLFRWKEIDGKTWGFWVGIKKRGLLPPKSYLDEKRAECGPEPPEEILNQFLSFHIDSGLQIKIESRAHQEHINLGFGSGSGVGIGSGSGEENNMALADKLRNEIYERTGKTPKLSDWLVTEFRKRVGTEKEKLAAFREYLTSNPESEYPLHEFLDSDISDQFTKPTVVLGVIANPALISLASKVFTIADFAVSGKSLTAAENLLKIYPKLDILNAFRYFYGKLDDFSRKHAVRDFFEKGAAEPVILAMKEYQEHQADIIKRAEAVSVTPVPVRKTEEDEGDQIDF